MNITLPTVARHGRIGHARCIALMNQKGGVGKTTTTVNLGAALAQRGKRVLMVDLDPQAHLTLHLGVDPDQVPESLYDLLTDDKVSAFQIVHDLDHLAARGGALAVLPGNVNLAGVEGELHKQMATGLAQRKLRAKCHDLIEQGFDYVLIDCPPSLGLLSVNALTLASEVIVPMQAHFLALQGLSKLLETISLIGNTFNPGLSVTGVVLCMHERQTLLASEVVAEVKTFLDSHRNMDVPWSRAVVLDPPIRRNIKLAESPSFGQTIFQYAADSNGAQDYDELAQSIDGSLPKAEVVEPEDAASDDISPAKTDETAGAIMRDGPGADDHPADVATPQDDTDDADAEHTPTSPYRSAHNVVDPTIL